MSSEPNYKIAVDVEANFISEQSLPEQNRYVFSYTVTIKNEGNVAARLLTRHWIINHANGKSEEVKGDGVIGKQPHLNPGEGFRYTSGTILETPAGDMTGSYQMIADDGVEFDAEIPPFMLSVPNTLH